MDDLLIIGTTISLIHSFNEQMNKSFDMSDLGRLSHYLGIEVVQSKGSIELKQTSYAKKVLEKSGMTGCKPTKYPMEPTLQLYKDTDGKPVDSTEYKSIMVCL